MKTASYAPLLLLVVGLWSCDRDDASELVNDPEPEDRYIANDPSDEDLGSGELSSRDTEGGPKGVSLYINEGEGWKEDFEAGCWRARKHKRSSGGSCANSDANEWLNSQMQGEKSGLVVDRLLYFEDGVWKSAQPRKGNYAMRFRWTKSDFDMGDENNTKKAHLWTPFEFTKKATRSYGFSIFLPSGPRHMNPDSQDEILIQWKGYPRRNVPNLAPENWEPFRVPVLSFKHVGSTLKAEYWYDARLWSRNAAWMKAAGKTFKNRNGDYVSWATWQPGEKDIDLGPATLNQWIDFTVKVTWDYDGSGYLEINRRDVDENGGGTWVNKATRNGIRIGYNDISDPQVGVGIYKFSEGNVGSDGRTLTSDYEGRQFYFDEFKYGADGEGPSDVAP